jgi:hypothetical protein
MNIFVISLQYSSFYVTITRKLVSVQKITRNYERK